jgi:CHAT domain-containing protein
MQAGVVGVAGSLWSVNEASTMLLMTHFYEGWQGKGLKPSEALRQAQIWLRDTTNAYWEIYLEPHMNKLSSMKMSEQAIHYAFRDVLMQDTGGRIFAHPFYWAAFGYTGL